MSYPALVSDPLWPFTPNTNTDHVGAGEEQVLGQFDALGIAHLLDQRVDGHGRDQLAILDGRAVFERDLVSSRVDLGHITRLAESLLRVGDGSSDSSPDSAGAVVRREAEGSIRTPVTGHLVHDDIVDEGFEVRRGDTLAQPRALHLGLVSI